MSKQIYIDSNGNEVLVSGTIINDNNLPHYTGTPTAGTTAEAINLKDIATELTMNLGNFTASTKNVYCAGNVVNICLRGSLTATSATAIGSITSKYKPKCERIICELHDNTAPMPITTGAVWINGQNGNLYYFGSSVTSKDVCLTVTYIADIY